MIRRLLLHPVCITSTAAVASLGSELADTPLAVLLTTGIAAACAITHVIRSHRV